MPAKDIFHNAVKRALEKDGWIITDDPLYLDFGGVELYTALCVTIRYKNLGHTITSNRK